jgi:hypothetical protein
MSIAMGKGRRDVVKYACEMREFWPILNAQDSEGNTALHVAVMGGNPEIFNFLVRNRRVRLDLSNNQGHTPLDISFLTMFQLLAALPARQFSEARVTTFSRRLSSPTLWHSSAPVWLPSL